MDSDSDWDSMSDGSILNTKSEIKSNVKNQQAEKSKQNVKSPYHKSKIESKHEPRPPQNKKEDLRTAGITNNGFQSVELEDRSHLEPRRVHTKKKQNFPNNQDLPYTKFQVDSPQKKSTNPPQIRGAPDDKNSWDDENSEEDDSDDDTENIMENNNDIYGDSFVHDKVEIENVIAKETKSPEKNKKTTHNNDFSMYMQSNNIQSQSKQAKNKTIFSTPRKKSKGKQESPDPKVKDKQNQNKSFFNNGEDDANLQIVEKRYYYEESHKEYHLTIAPGNAVVPKIADRLAPHIHRGWEEFFGILRLIFNLIIIFMLELFKFLLVTLLQKLLIGIIVLLGDYLMKPLLSNLFNSIIQPVFIFLLNLFVGLRRLLSPVIQILTDILQPVANLLKSFRLFEYQNHSRGTIKEV